MADDSLAPKPDPVERVLAEWRAARPDLDPAPLELVGRVLVLATALEARVAAALAPFELTLGQFDILATLRRHPDGRLSPSGLLERVVLSSGGMTSRLDKLEAAGWVERAADPADRRGVVVTLTAAGQELIDRATAARFADAAAAAPDLPGADRVVLAGWLKAWLAAVGG